MQSSNQHNFSACSTTACSVAKNNTAGCCSLRGVVTPTLQAPRERWDSTRDLDYMNMHNPVCLSPHCFGAFISQRGGIFHPQPAGFYSGSLAGLRLGLDLFFFFEIEILKNTCVGNKSTWADKLFCSFVSCRHIICHLANVDRCACE